MKNLMIIGTSHISKDSVEEVKKAFEDFNPEIVALELDARRLYALMHNVNGKPELSDIKRVGVRGYLLMVIGSWIQKKLGEHVGSFPGSEMKTAVLIAKERNAKIALIDQDIETTIKNVSKAFGIKEQLSLIKELILSPFSKKLKIELSKVPEKKLIKKLMKEAKKSYPRVYKALVEDRNRIMAKNITKLVNENPNSKILVIVGAGHEDDIAEMLNKSLVRLVE